MSDYFRLQAHFKKYEFRKKCRLGNNVKGESKSKKKR